METKIYRKTQEEIDEEQGLLDFGAQIAHAPYAEKACETYIINKDGEKINTTALSAIDVVIIAMNNKNLEIKNHITKEQYIKDFSTLQEIMNLAEFTQTSQSKALLADVIGSLGGNKLLEKARVILFYEKEIKGEKVNLEGIISSLAKHEKELKRENQ